MYSVLISAKRFSMLTILFPHILRKLYPKIQEEEEVPWNRSPKKIVVSLMVGKRNEHYIDTKKPDAELGNGAFR